MMRAKKFAVAKTSVALLTPALLLLAFYGVSGAPATDAPNDNIPPPLTKGTDQHKDGKLGVGSLNVEGAMQVGSRADVEGTETCNSSLAGALLFDTGDQELFLCNGSSWNALN